MERIELLQQQASAKNLDKTVLLLKISTFVHTTRWIANKNT